MATKSESDAGLNQTQSQYHSNYLSTKYNIPKIIIKDQTNRNEIKTVCVIPLKSSKTPPIEDEQEICLLNSNEESKSDHCSSSDDAKMPLLLKPNEKPTKFACNNYKRLTIKEKYLMKYDEYEQIYQYKYKIFHSRNNPSKCILKNRISDKDRIVYVGDYRKLIQKYSVKKEKVHYPKGFEFRYAIKRKDPKEEKNWYMMKSYKYITKQQAKKATQLLCAWIAMRKLGIIIDGDIYHDQYNHAVRLIMKSWDTDLRSYIVKNCGDKNMFRRSMSIALFMKDIVGQLKLIHDNGMMYCGVKPSDILMDYDQVRNIPMKFGLVDYEMVTQNPRKYHREFGSQMYRPSEMQKYKNYDILATDKWDIFSLGITLLELMDGKHPYGMDLMRWKEKLDDLHHVKRSVDKYSIHLFMDQNVLNKCVASNVVLNRYSNKRFFVELKDLIRNMINDDFGERYNINDVMQHRWFQHYCT